MPDASCQRIDTCKLSSIEQQLTEILNAVNAMHHAFPPGEDGEADFLGHRRFHDAKIKAAQAETAFWNELKLDLAKKGAWALLLIITGLVVTGAAVKLGISGVLLKK